MFNWRFGERRCRLCNRRRDRCICHTCNCGATVHYSGQLAPVQQAPQPMRIEYLQPLVITQPEFSRRRENVPDEPQEQPAPKDAPVPMTYNEWFEFDDSGQEGPDIEDTNA